MARTDDNARCVILVRDGARHQWEKMAITLRKSVAWRSAAITERQEWRLGHKGFKAIVVLEEDLDAGRLRQLRPPASFELNPLQCDTVDCPEPVPTPVPAPVQEEEEETPEVEVYADDLDV